MSEEKIVSYSTVCRICARAFPGEPSDGMIFNLATNVWHWQREPYATTVCGHDATSDRWWWPL